MNHTEENKNQQDDDQIESDSFSFSTSSEVNQDFFSPPLEDIRDRIRFYFDPINKKKYDHRSILTQVIDSLENREDHSEQILLAKAENLPLQSLADPSSTSTSTSSCSINGFLQAVPSDSIEGLMSVSKQSGALNAGGSFFINITTDNRSNTNNANKCFIKARNSIGNSSSYKFEGLISLNHDTLMQSLSSNFYSEKNVFSKSVHPIDAIAHDLLKVENSCFRPYHCHTNTDNYEDCYNVSDEEAYRVICRRILNLDI